MADLEEARKRYLAALDALREQRQIIQEDQAFTDPVTPDQWDVAERQQRENDPGGSRPCLVFDQIGQYVENVAGQVEQRPPSMHAVPVDSKGDKRLAEKLEGIFRHVEYQSRALQHYAVAERSAARVGIGYLTLRPEYVDRALNYQEPRIGSVGDPLRAVLDPWSVEIDGSDAECGWVLTPYSHGAFERRFGAKAEKVSFGETEFRNDPRESIIVAEEWLVEEVKANCIVVYDASGEQITLSEDDYWEKHNRGEKMVFVRNYPTKEKRVRWRVMSGAAILEFAKDPVTGKEKPYPASGIGLVPVYGYVGFSDGRLKFAGMGRKARDQQRAYNYHKSEERALMSAVAKAPWMIPIRAYGGDEDIKRLWDRASVETRATLQYHDWDAFTQTPISPPQKLQPSIDLRNHIMAAEEARNNIRAALGMYAPSLGEPSNETSGVAIQERKAQGDAATALFPANLAASVGQIGRLTGEMIPKLMDTPRQQRILAIDGSSSSVRVDPDQADAVVETPDGLVINPNVGRYDFRVTVGAAFTTQRSQANQVLGEIMARNPAMSQMVAPIWAMNLDFLGAEKLAEVFIAALPPELKSVYKPEEKGQPTSAQLQQTVAQLQAALQEAVQHAQEAMQEADEAKRALDDKEEEFELKQAELRIRDKDADTKRLQVVGAQQAEIEAVARQTILSMLTAPPVMEDPMPETAEMQLMPAGDGLGSEPQPEVMEQPAMGPE